MKVLKSMIACTLLVLACTGMVFAQVQQQPQQPQQPQMPDVPAPEDISDEELLAFLQTSDAIQPIQVEAQEEMQKIIEDEGMEFQRFQQIMMSMQNPQMADQVEVSADEEETIQAMQPKLMEVEAEATEEITSEISNQGLEVERYQAIFMSLQQNPDLMERLEELMDDEDDE